ncbi:MAG: hypothetical protein K940chlam7_01745 [Chlamydiae bacterium]|nr:hypothetical protein [Chlamydiota bacterium]
MSETEKHLVFYDGQCGMCDRSVQFLLKADRNKKFVFAPLQGKTASERLQELPKHVKSADSLILIENFETSNEKVYIYGHGAFRIAWLLGGKWSLLGWISFLPPVLYDWGYRFIARNRHHFFSKIVCYFPDESEKDRFLP